MRNLLRLLTFAVTLLTLTPVFAQEPGAVPPMSAEDAARLRSQLSQLGVVFGVEQPKGAATPDAKEAPAQKNMAEVADRALSMVSGLIASVSQSVQKAAPEVWRIMVTQQYAKALGNMINPFLVCLLIAGYYQFVKSKFGAPNWGERWDDTEWAQFWLGQALPIIAGLIAGLCLASDLSQSIQYLINPEYYAVRDILIMVMDPVQSH